MTNITSPALAEHAAEIRRLGKRVVADVIEIGRRLTECKRICGHGNFLPWLAREFKWDERTARNFMSVHEMALKSENFSDLDLPISGLYLLAAPGTPGEARAEIIKRAHACEPVQVAEVKRSIAEAKGRNQPARKTSTKPPQILEEVLHQRDAAAERIRGRMGGNKVADSESDEQARLRHFEFQNIALRSEVEELRAHVRGLEDRGLRAVPLEKLVDELEHRLPAALPKKHLAALKALRGALGGRHLGPTLNLNPVVSEATKH
jgi:hypothetical protein